MSGNGQFQTSNGQILDPNGNVFTAHGVNVMFGGDQPTVDALKSDFPGINFVRLAVYNYDSPDALSSYVNQLTNAGIVVELENHQNNAGGAGGSQGSIFTGQQLTQETNWYSSVASAFKNNPFVWFGTNNEPSETDSSGNNDPAALSQWQQTTYNAIRGAGNNNPIMVEINGWGDPNSMASGYTPSVYAGMTNVIGDLHFYGWLTNYSTDQSTVSNFLTAAVQHTQQTLPTASGTMPVLIGEFGNSTTGHDLDANANQVINAVTTSNVTAGYAAWMWGQGAPYDGLTTGGTTLSSYGQQIASAIQASASTSASLPPPAVTPTQPASADNSVVTAAGGGTITDANGANWTIQNGQVMKNGAAAGYSANVTEIAYVKGVIYQENTDGNWWNWDGSTWTGSGTATSPLPKVSADNTVVQAGSTDSITDAAGNAWTISNGVVNENGAAAGYSANVTEIAYAGGSVYQENSAGSWWQWNGTTWTGASASPVTGGATTPTPPVTPPTPPVTPPTPPTPPVPTVSPDNTVVAAGSTSAITDADQHAWTIDNGAVMEDGKAAGYSANVTEIAYVGGNVYQENSSNMWWEWNGSTWAGNGSTTSPIPSTPTTPPVPPVTPDTIALTYGGVTQVATPGSSEGGDTFSLLSGGVVQASLGSTPQMVQFTGSSGAQVTGGSGVAIVSATDGANSFAAGSGPMMVTGGTGSDAYTYHAGAGFLGIQDFSSAKGDTLNVDSSLKAGMQSMNDGAGGTMLAFGGGSVIDLHGVTTAPVIHWT